MKKINATKLKNIFYGDFTCSILFNLPWAYHSAYWQDGFLAGELSFSFGTGVVDDRHGSRLLFF